MFLNSRVSFTSLLRRLPPSWSSIFSPCIARFFSSFPTQIEASNNAFFARNSSPLPSTHPLAHLRSDLTSRPSVLITDHTQQIPSNLLHNTLYDFLPKSYHETLSEKRQNAKCAPPGYHLIYFPPPDPLSHLLTDGTDPAHSPGEPFNRRMWAGGFMHFREDLPFDCKPRSLSEKIANVEVKGSEGEEKVFVRLERLVLNDRSIPLIIEGRTLVFMRDRTAEAPAPKMKNVKPPAEPHYSHSVFPTSGLLFRFSALTFNAHRIHLDKQYCQQVEGHRNLLVHGPLSLVLMLEMLQGHLGHSTERVVRVEYKNLAPLYAEEKMTVCGKGKRTGEYEVWIEGPEGGLAVKGTVITDRSQDVV